jgi:hypothetical protein
MYMLTIVTDTYSRTDSGKSWRTKPDETKTETFSWDATPETIGDLNPGGRQRHRKITDPDTLSWFRRLGGSEHAVRSYTPVGYIVTRLVSTNPDRTVRIVRRFRITDLVMCAEGGCINDDNPGRPICRTCDDDPNVSALYAD